MIIYLEPWSQMSICFRWEGVNEDIVFIQTDSSPWGISQTWSQHIMMGTKLDLLQIVVELNKYWYKNDSSQKFEMLCTTVIQHQYNLVSMDFRFRNCQFLLLSKLTPKAVLGLAPSLKPECSISELSRVRHSVLLASNLQGIWEIRGCDYMPVSSVSVHLRLETWESHVDVTVQLESTNSQHLTEEAAPSPPVSTFTITYLSHIYKAQMGIVWWLGVASLHLSIFNRNSTSQQEFSGSIYGWLNEG